MKSNFSTLFSQAAQVGQPTVSVTSNGGNSFGIVFSRKNGKRLTFSKNLSVTLGLDDKVALLFHTEAGVLFAFKPNGLVNASTLNLKDCDGAKIAYSGPMVELIVKSYGLDYSKCVSKSFRDIEFDAENGQTIAMIHLNPGTLPVNASDNTLARGATSEDTAEALDDEGDDILLEDEE